MNAKQKRFCDEYLIDCNATQAAVRAGYSSLQEMGINTSFSRLDTRKIDKVLTRPWTTDRNTFSDRIWNNKAKLINTVNTQLTQAFIRGSPSNKATQAIAKAMNVSRHQASRLVITESAFFASAACQDCYKDLGVERYEILATLDKRTCSDCGELEGKPIALKDYQVGSTAPPFHPYCRCTAIPYFADFTDGETRSAREEDGKSKYIKNQNYDSWKKKQVKKSQKSAILKEITLEPIEITEETIARVKPLSGTYMTSKQAQMLADRKKELLRYVQNEPAGTEAVFGVDMKGNKLIQKIGGYGNVKTQPIDTPYMLIHNHPTGYTFTLGDISAFAMDENMIALTVVGNNGDIYLIEKELDYSVSGVYQELQSLMNRLPDYQKSPQQYLNFMELFLKEASKYGQRYTKSR